MLKVVIVAAGANAVTLNAKLQQIRDLKVMQIIHPADVAAHTVQISKADFVITEPDMLLYTLQRKSGSAASRQQVKAVTHQGIRLVPIENIFYFQAEHKYVTVVHTQGTLLIEDSLNSLENEFAGSFVRIHRKTLVATHRIEGLIKDEQDQYFVKVRGVDDLLMVSRRRVAQIRSILLC